MNILVLSAGTRNKIIQYLKKALHGMGIVVATDMDCLAPALYEADKHYIVPPVDEAGYMDDIHKICRIERIEGVLSLIDPEVNLLAQHKVQLISSGINLIGSSYELCEIAFDKYKMYKWLFQHAYKAARSWIDKEEFFKEAGERNVSYPVFIKPVKGSASSGISMAYSKDEVDRLFARSEGLMVQEYMDGQEIGADVYVDMISGEVVSIFTKKKIKMRAGETDKAESFKDEKLFRFIERFVTEAGYRGPIDIDIFDIRGEYFISEVNPRFGGGYPHAYEAGCDHMKMIVENLRGNINPKEIGNYTEGIYMMKYNEIQIWHR